MPAQQFYQYVEPPQLQHSKSITNIDSRLHLPRHAHCGMYLYLRAVLVWSFKHYMEHMYLAIPADAIQKWHLSNLNRICSTCAIPGIYSWICEVIVSGLISRENPLRLCEKPLHTLRAVRSPLEALVRPISSGAPTQTHFELQARARKLLGIPWQSSCSSFPNIGRDGKTPTSISLLTVKEWEIGVFFVELFQG